MKFHHILICDSASVIFINCIYRTSTMRKQQYNVNKIPQTTRFRDFISRMSQYDIGDPEEWIHANPQKRIFIVFEANKLAFRVMTRKETDLEYLVKDFREDDQSMYFMQRYSGNTLDPYRYSVSPFGYFQPGLLTSVLKALQGNVMINPMGRPVLEFTCLSDGVKRYMIEWLSPLMRQVKQLQSKLGDDLQVSNISVDRMPEDKVLVMRDYQEKAIEAVLTAGFGRGMIESATGCHAKGTNILMMDGSIKKVEDIKVGDCLIGDDGQVRNVLSLCHGIGHMYKIIPTNGIPFIVNEDHVLSLVRSDFNENKNPPSKKYGEKHWKKYDLTKDGYVIDISVKEYLRKDDNFKHLHKLYRSTSILNFDKQENNDLFISPYLMGLILGDGCITIGCSIVTADEEIKMSIYSEAQAMGMHIRESSKKKTSAKSYHFLCKEGTRGKNQLNNELRRLGLFGHKSGDKFIPDCYKYGSSQVRFQILAGLLDTDGYAQSEKSYTILLKSKQMISDIAFIARSLGIRTFIKKKVCKCTTTGTVGTYWYCSLSGENAAKIPVRVKRKILSTHKSVINQMRTGFTIEDAGWDEYYGFVLDGNHRYIMADDGFITHNSGKSFIIANLIYTLWSLGLPKPNARTLIYVPNIQLVEQFYTDLLSYGYKEDEVCKCSGALKTADKRKMAQCSRTAPIVIANSAWCNNHIQEVGDIDILLIDEVHRCTPDSVGFTNLREQLCECKVRVGFSGTIPQDCYNRWELEGLLGPVIYRASVTSLQDQGYLSQLRIVKVKLTDKQVVDDDNLLFSPHSKWRQNDYSAEYGGLITATDAWIAEQDWYSTHCARIFAPVLNNLILADPNTKLTNTLILFDRLALGESLFNHLDTNVEAGKMQGLKVLYIDGQTEVQERERIRASLESSNGNILLGQSSILSTGINIKNLGRIVLLCGGKAQARIIQSIGRTLRLSANKDHAELVDVELSYKYSHRHALERKHLYKEWYNKDKFDETYEFDV